MKLLDVLLVVAGVCLIAAGFVVSMPLGLLALSVSCVAAWWLLREVAA